MLSALLLYYRHKISENWYDYIHKILCTFDLSSRYRVLFFPFFFHYWTYISETIKAALVSDP